MLDWSKTFNIALVAALGALIVFCLVSTIVVAAKGKRKCNAFDVILRIVSTLVFIASAAMLTASVLTMLNGSFCIKIAVASVQTTDVIPYLIFGETSVELPLPELFVALSSAMGLMLSALLFICSLAALIVDCLVANKKIKKTKKSKVQKTPEQLKREAELDKIRKLGEDAVKRVGHAAKYADSSAKKNNAGATRPVANAQAQQPVTVRQEPAPQTEPETDWRTKPAEPERSAEFVGLSKNSDPDFDTFDTFDDIPDEESYPVQTSEEFDDIIAENDVAETAEQVEENVEVDADTKPQQSDLFTDENETDEADSDDRYDLSSAESDETAEETEESLELYEPLSSEQSAETTRDDDRAEEQAQGVEYAAPADERVNESNEPAFDSAYSARNDDESGSDARADRNDELEPNRDIYIPGIRTIVRRNDDAPAVRGKTNKSTARKTPQKSGSKSKAGNKASAAKKPVGARNAAPKKSASARTPSAAKVNTGSAVESGKKLPVTRRYVILDRRNAVNMFGEYLKDRNQAEKDKLKSSINTIIIE